MAITVSAANDAPVAGDDAAPQAVLESTSLSVDAAHGVLANDTDVDGGALSVSAVPAGRSPAACSRWRACTARWF